MERPKAEVSAQERSRTWYLQVRLSGRQDEIFDNDRSKKGIPSSFHLCWEFALKISNGRKIELIEGVDARHFLPQREERPLPQHPGQQCLHQVTYLGKEISAETF